MTDKQIPDIGLVRDDERALTSSKDQTSTPKAPGKIKHGAVEITLHSIHAFELYRGRPGTSTQHAVVGLKGFARALDRITDREHIDRIEDALLDAQERIQQIKQQIDKAFARNHLRTKEESVSKNPTVIVVTLHTRQAHRGAQLLSEYDEQIIRCLSLYKLGVHGRHEHNAMVRSLTQTVRKAFTSPVFTQAAVINAKETTAAETSDNQSTSPAEPASTPAQN